MQGKNTTNDTFIFDITEKDLKLDLINTLKTNPEFFLSLSVEEKVVVNNEVAEPRNKKVKLKPNIKNK